MSESSQKGFDHSENLENEQQEKELGSLNPMQVIGSVFAAGLGVQSSKNRERDFKQGKFGVFVAAGIVFTLLFMGTVYGIVQLVLKNTGN
ncbi:MAG: DUF2970 domain-containing protein [Halioglobus sp.]